MNSRFTRAAAGVLLLAALWLAAGPGASAREKPPKSHDITDTIYANPILTSFAKLLQASPDIYTFLQQQGTVHRLRADRLGFRQTQARRMPDSLLRPENSDRRQRASCSFISSTESGSG